MDDLRSDFRKFLFVIWRYLGFKSPTPVQYDIADYTQQPIKRKIIQAFRGVGKSWITSAYVLWRLHKDPNYKGLVVSASKARSDAFTTFTKRLIRDIPFLTYLAPGEGQRDSMVMFDVGPTKPAHAPSVASVGIFGQLTGSRATEIIADDCEVAQNSWTQDMRDKLLKAVLEFEAIIVPDEGQITYLGTPQTEESTYNKLRQRGYNCRIWPARYPQLDKLHLYGGALAPWIEDAIHADPTIVGKPTDPGRFNHTDLLEREGAYGRSGFALQFMLDTTLSDADKYPLKTSDLIVFSSDVDKAPISISYASSPDNQIKEFPNIGFSGDRLYRPLFVDKEWTPYEGSVMAIDPSGRGLDTTGYAVVKHLHGKLYVRRCGGLKGGYDDSTLISLAKIAMEEKVNYIVIESNFGDGMFVKVFQPILSRYHKCSIEEVRHHTQKELRILDTLEPVMSSHRLIIDYDVVKNDLKAISDDTSTIHSLLYQMTHITKDRGALKHDDQLDALAIAVKYWLDAMARDTELAVDSYREDQIDKQLQEFINHCVGNTSKMNTQLWMSV